MRSPQLLVLLVLAVQLSDALPERPTVVVSDGRGFVIGRRLSSKGADGHAVRDYAAFYGIPFGKAPIGELRFKAPEPAPAITSVLMADSYNQSLTCIQYRRTEGLLGGEDCLRLNIFTPSVDRPNLDVIVFIHGGGFMYGEGKAYGEEALMDRDVVLVTIEYRLGILGFMSLEDRELPGNLGLLDQVLALQWIRDNIGVFGGNKNSVTILGFSAGSASGFLHTLSPLSRGLFHRFISVSGSYLSPWTRQYKARENALRVGQLLNCTRSTSSEMLACLRGKDAREIASIQPTHFQGFKETPFSPFSVVVDGSFLPRDPRSLLTERRLSNPVPVLMGLCKDEGLYTAAEFITDPVAMQTLEREWDNTLPGLMHYHQSLLQDADRAFVARRIREEYIGNASIASSGPAIVKMGTHRNFFVGIADQARLQAAAAAAPVHLYLFAYRGQHSLSVSMTNGRVEDMGVSHADDLMYPFYFRWAGELNTPSDRLMRRHFIDMWVTFANSSVARFGSAVWNPVSRRESDNLHYLYVSSPTNMSMMHSSDLGNSHFWKSLPFIENGSQGTISMPSSSSSLAITLATLLLLFLTGLH